MQHAGAGAKERGTNVRRGRRRIAHLVALAIIAATALVQAAVPSGATSPPVNGSLYFTTCNGSDVRRVSYYYDGSSSIGFSSDTKLGTVAGTDGIAFAPNGTALIGSGGPQLNNLNTANGNINVVPTATNSNSVAVRPDGSGVYTTADPGSLVYVPVPIGSGGAQPVELTGTGDTELSGIVFDPNFASTGNAYYVRSFGGNAHFGVLHFTDATHATTTLLLYGLPTTYGMVYDSYSYGYLLFGANRVTEIFASSGSATTGSTLTLPSNIGTVLGRGTVDGQGHLFVPDSSGRMWFVDYATNFDIGFPDLVTSQPLATCPHALAPLVGPGARPNAPTNAAPIIRAYGTAGPEGSPLPVQGSAFDSEGDPLTIGWSVATVNAESGTSCVVGNLAALATTVTCDDDGQFTLTLSVDDGHNPTVTASAPLGVGDVLPTVTSLILEPTSSLDSRVLTNSLVSFRATATDPSTRDLSPPFWSFNGGSFQFSGTFTTSFSTCGSYTVTAQVWDRNTSTGMLVGSNILTSDAVTAYDGHFRAPLAEGSYNAVKAGQVVPVKIDVGCGSLVSGLHPAIQLLSGDLDPRTDYGDPTLNVTTASVSGADTDGVMRQVDGQYLYNLRVPANAPAGALYTVRVRPFGGITGGMYVVLKVRK